MSDADAKLVREARDRVKACEEQIAASPFSHTVAAGWYAEDVPRLMARCEEAEQANQRLKDWILVNPDAKAAEAEVERLREQLKQCHEELSRWSKER